MKSVLVVLGAFFISRAAFPQIKPCEELKSEIAAKIEANGAKNYQLEIVPAADVKEQTVVGSCEGGSKKITYQKTDGSAPVSGTSTAKPKPAAPAKGH
jgi:hypothetical protein